MDPIILATACSASAGIFATIASAWFSARRQRVLLRELAKLLDQVSDGQISSSN